MNFGQTEYGSECSEYSDIHAVIYTACITKRNGNIQKKKMVSIKPTMHEWYEHCVINFSVALTSTTSLVWRTADLSGRLADTCGDVG